MAHSYSYSKHGSTARDMQGVPVRTVSAQLGLLDYVPLWEAPRLGGGAAPLLIPLLIRGSTMSSWEVPDQVPT